VVESREVRRRVLADGDHEISCKMDGMAIGLKACFVKKA
jgi:protein PhnA